MVSVGSGNGQQSFHPINTFSLWFGYLKQGNLQNPNPVECKSRKLLPDNMLYLLVMCPFMLPAGTGQIWFQDRFAKAIQFFKHNKGIEGRRLAKGYVPISTEVLTLQVKGDKSKHVLFDACRLAKSLQLLGTYEKWSPEQKGHMICDVWVEMLCYAASQCRWNLHANLPSSWDEGESCSPMYGFWWLLLL